ncbi:MAG: hypothetical protein LBB67_06365 [Oscillospiraceae bacterium]|jgi:hypothetical protein|nr:hypothetical protein [Oscillospiraceae bacterium]
MHTRRSLLTQPKKKLELYDPACGLSPYGTGDWCNHSDAAQFNETGFNFEEKNGALAYHVRYLGAEVRKTPYFLPATLFAHAALEIDLFILISGFSSATDSYANAPIGFFLAGQHTTAYCGIGNRRQGAYWVNGNGSTPAYAFLSSLNNARHTYRLERHGEQAAFYIDGIVKNEWTALTPNSSIASVNGRITDEIPLSSGILFSADASETIDVWIYSMRYEQL